LDPLKLVSGLTDYYKVFLITKTEEAKGNFFSFFSFFFFLLSKTNEPLQRGGIKGENARRARDHTLLGKFPSAHQKQENKKEEKKKKAKNNAPLTSSLLTFP
jgi:hypothetical protein